MDAITLTKCVVDTSQLDSVSDDLLDLATDGMATVATWMPPKLIQEIGLPRGSVCGVVPDKETKLCAENFSQNRDFIDIIHSINSSHHDRGLIDYAKTTADKSIAVIDQRSEDVNATIPPEDVIGVYDVESNAVGTYHPNPNYQLVTESGVFQLTPWLRHCLTSTVGRPKP